MCGPLAAESAWPAELMRMGKAGHDAEVEHE
jgi:hypothetical protein